MTETKRPFGERGGCTHRIFVCGACLTEYCGGCRSHQCPHRDLLEERIETEVAKNKVRWDD